MENNTATQEVDITEVMSSLKKNSDSTAKLCEVITMGFDEIKKTWVPKVVETGKPADTAALEESKAGVLGKVGNVSVAGVKIVPLVGGAFVSIFASELIDGFMASKGTTVKAVVKGVGAFAAYKWGKKLPLIGAEGGKVIALLLAFDAIRDLTPINSWASAAANKVSGMIPIGGLGDQTGRAIKTMRPSLVKKDYYSTAFGRS